MVFRWILVLRPSSLCLFSLLSNVLIVDCSDGFKTFILSLPFVNGTNGSMHVLSPSAADVYREICAARWGILKWPQVGDFGWPSGVETKARIEASAGRSGVA